MKIFLLKKPPNSNDISKRKWQACSLQRDFIRLVKVLSNLMRTIRQYHTLNCSENLVGHLLIKIPNASTKCVNVGIKNSAQKFRPILMSPSNSFRMKLLLPWLIRVAVSPTVKKHNKHGQE